MTCGGLQPCHLVRAVAAASHLAELV